MTTGKLITKKPPQSLEMIRRGLGPFVPEKQADACRTHRHICCQFSVVQGEGGWEKCIKAAIVLCSLFLGSPARASELWQKCRCETAAVTRLDISWLKPLGSLVPVEQMVPSQDAHAHVGVVQWVEFTSSVKNAPVMLSALTAAELHTCA